MYSSKEKMVGSACTSSHSSRCLSKFDWSGHYMYLGDVIPSSGITVKIESDDKDCDDGNGILTNGEAVHDQELEGKSDVYVPDQEVGGKCDREVPAQELEGKCDMAVHDQEIEGKYEVALHDQETEGKGDIAVHEQEFERKCDVDVPDEEINEQFMDVKKRITDGIIEQFMDVEKRITDGIIVSSIIFCVDMESLYRYGNARGNVDKENIQQLRFPLENWFQIRGNSLNSVLVIENVQQLRLPITMYQILQETIQTSVLYEEYVQQFFEMLESNQNSVHSKTSCCFEPMVNTKRHGNNEEYYNFNHDENRNQENMKRTDHKEFIGKSTEHTKSNNCSMFTTRILMILLMMLPTFVMSESTMEKCHEQYLWHSDGRFSDQIETLRNGKTELFIDIRVIKDDNRVIKDDNRVIKDDNRVIKDDNRVIKDDNIVIKEDNIVIKDDNRVIKEDNIVIKEDNRVIKEDNRVIKEDNRVIKEDNRVIKEDNRVIREDNRVIKEDNRVIKEDNIVIKEDYIVIKEDNRVIKGDNRVIKEDNIVIKDDTRVIKDDTRVIKDDTRVIKEDYIVIKEDYIVIKCDNRVIKEDNIVIKEDYIVIKEDYIVIKEDYIVIKGDNIVIKEIKCLHISPSLWPWFEEDETFQCYDYLFVEERSEQRDTNSESCTRKSSVYVELAPILKPHCFINLSELKALSQNVILQKKAAKQKKTSKDSLSHEQTSTMFKVMIVCVLVVVAYLIIMERLSLVLSSTFKTSVSAALCLVVLSSYQMYYVVSIVVARMEIKRKKQIYDGNDGTHLLTDYERLYVIVYFCGSLVPGLWIYNELTKKLDPVELLIMCTTVCLTMMVVAWTTYLLHQIVLEGLIEILLIASNVLVNIVAVFTRFVSVVGVFIVSLLEFIFRRLSEIFCVILMIFVTILEHATKIAMLITLVVCRILEKFPGHSSIKALQNDLKTKCLMFKMLLNGKIVLRKPMNCDVMQARMIEHETAQCCDRIRSCGVDSNMEDVFCEIENEKVKHLQETTEGHQFIESVSEVDHGKKLIDHSLNIDCEVCDAMERSETEIDENYERSTTNDVYSSETIILTDLLHSTPVDGDHEVCDTMERSETEIAEINYEKSTTNDVYSNKTIILTDLLYSTPVERDHEVFVAMEMSETEIDKISYERSYERSTTDDMFSNETIIPTDLSRSTPVERDHKFCDTMEKSETEIDKISYERAYERSTTDDMYSNETIILKDLSHSTPAERNHLSTKKSIHEETNLKSLVCNDTTCSLDEDNLVRVELEDSEDLSLDEFNITQDDDLNYDALQGSHGHPCSEDNDIADQNVFDYMRSIEKEEDGEPFCRNTKLEDDDEPFCHNTKSTSIDRYSNRVWSLPDYHMISELNMDYQVIPELNKGDISNTSMKSDSEFASNSLKNGSDNGSLSSSCSCNVDAHVFNCQVDSLHSFVNDSSNAMQSSRTVIDLQKRQESKSHASIVDSKKKPLLKEMINENVSTTENVCTIVRNTIETIKQKSVSNLTDKSCKKCFTSYRKKPRRRLTRRRLRRLIYPRGNISHVHVDIEVRPHLNGPQGNATTIGSAIGLNKVGAAALATSQQSLMTSLPSSSNSLNNYFSKLLSGYEFSTDEKMQFEMLRVQSFQDLPASCNVSPLRLARTGFFSSGSSDEVTCFSCGIKHKNWQNNDNPNDVHHRISPDCRMVNGRETRNIPVSQQHNGIIEHSGQQESLAHTTNDFAQSTIHYDGDVSTQTTEASQNREMTMEEVIESNIPDNIQKSGNIKPPVHQPYSGQPALDSANTDQQYARQPATNRAGSVPDQNRPAQRDMAEDLGINLDKPKYPAYAQLNVRVSTFQGWPGYLDQTPRDMALAGFFYAGYNDYCRCFFCGGGLRNWDSGDDPWVEHTRWFPKCAFVQQNRGRRFVEIIVKRQAEMQASGSSVGNTRNQRAIKTQIGTGERSETSSQTSSQSADSNSNIDPAKASVRELGYADEIIDRAITIIKQNNPGKQKIEATDIMEVIFTITEDSGTNTAVASENTPSSELNLPSTRRAIPQSNVSSQSNQPVSHSSQSNKPQVSKPNPQAAVASQSTNASENSLPSLSVSSLEHGNTAAAKSASKEISENEIRSLQEENIQLKEQVMCKICMDKNVSIAFLPCGHLACCIDCAPAMRKCPMCRVYIKGTVKTFLA